MKTWIGIGILLHATLASADPVKAQEHSARGKRWFHVLQYERAIEEFEQAYQEDGKIRYLYRIAESYEQMATMADTAAEAVKNKRRALKVYETFLAEPPDTDQALEAFRKAAAAHIEPLRQEIRDMETKVAEQEATLKDLRNDIKQLLPEVRTLRELLLRLHRGSTPADFIQ